MAAQLDAVEERLERIRHAGEEAWGEARDDLEDAFVGLSRAVKNLVSRRTDRRS